MGRVNKWEATAILISEGSGRPAPHPTSAKGKIDGANGKKARILEAGGRRARRHSSILQGAAVTALPGEERQPKKKPRRREPELRRGRFTWSRGPGPALRPEELVLCLSLITAVRNSASLESGAARAVVGFWLGVLDRRTGASGPLNSSSVENELASSQAAEQGLPRVRSRGRGADARGRPSAPARQRQPAQPPSHLCWSPTGGSGPSGSACHPLRALWQSSRPSGPRPVSGPLGRCTPRRYGWRGTPRVLHVKSGVPSFPLAAGRAKGQARAGGRLRPAQHEAGVR